ncbi:branched-chain amino acid transport system permease protein [Aurantimonas endophytica]|uniref:Branched-chain amino acid transport system permease protein n=1 Tax=Aurantimonas endophytica TaxID=1522175 RepID=A0A7W6HEH1_9HYPH|nr:branched-chain amino acid ABC transporter permease [Aurantimonas endophytica]MBB4003607.1 branched-chain amino acid transport system permease protein [Aurantimonas endophytica]MCO6404465.1 branched-chain amino acid ABC transporter permease [Aurantimonas endophytica]
MIPMRNLLVLAAILALLVAVPPFLDISWQNALVNVLIASLFALAFNLLIGQAGLLSFGHAAYFGVGAFAALHLMIAVEDGLPFPTPLLPLAGAAAGLLVGLVAGYFATMRSGVYFALVTLAIAELFHSLAPRLQDLFGGESGIASMRMPWQGLTFGSMLEVYYLTLFWVVACGLGLWAYTRTPFGRLTLALRDNEQRVRFLGYNAHASKVVIFAVSAMVTGVAGSLQAISNETANYSLFATDVSAQVVLQTFVGGSTVFFGPVIGATAFTLFSFLVSDLTRSWVFYQGLIFVLVMLYMPTGIGGVAYHHIRNRRRLDWSLLAGPYLLALVGGLLITAGIVFLTETVAVLFGEDYARSREAAEGGLPAFELFGSSWDPAGIVTWLIPLLLLLVGGAILVRARRRIDAIWSRPDRRKAGAGEPALLGGVE